MKKIISILLCVVMLFGSAMSVYALDETTIDDIISAAAEYLYKTVSNPIVGATGGEWTILGLSRSGEEIPNEYFRKYYSNVESYVRECQGVLHSRKYTEYSRVVLALTAIGKNPENVAGYNLTAPLMDYEKTIRQGLNGPVWALIALDCGNYGNEEIREKYISFILGRELENGGFALTKNETEVNIDVTAMTLVALSAYMDDENVKEAVNRAVSVLSDVQNENGDFSLYGTENPESAAQVLTAISALGISYEDTRFVKNGNSLVDNILSFYISGEGFSHIKNTETDIMATEQSLYALVAANRCKNGEKTLFDMSDKEQWSIEAFKGWNITESLRQLRLLTVER